MLLPVELLQSIFEIHTLVNLDSPHVLRQVCRHWLAIVDSTTILRTRIFFGVGWSIKGMVNCNSLGGVLQAIEKTRNFQRELTIASDYKQSQDANLHEAKWMEFTSSGTSRCRRLAINYIGYGSSLGNCDFPEQCELYIGRGICNMQDSQFLHAIERSSTQLRDLTVTESAVVAALRKYPLILRRLTRLSLKETKNLIPSSLWEHLVHLVDLTVSSELQLRDNIKFTLPCLSHLKMDISPRDALRPLAIYLQITNLTFTLDTGPVATTPMQGQRSPIRMPRLQRLEIHSIWSLIGIIDAPRLSVLVLRVVRPTPEYLLGLDDRALCQPKVLYIDMGKSVTDVHLAQRLSERWAKIEELHLRYVVEDSSPSYKLRTVLGGNTPGAPVCPRLRILKILMPPPISNAEIRRKNILKELRRMAHVRKSKDILEDGHCGWFTTSPLSPRKTIEEASRDWWNIEWFNLLE